MVAIDGLCSNRVPSLFHLFTSLPTHTPSHLYIMDPSESPCSNLDIWCDWTGEPTDPVEVVVSVEVRDAAQP